MLKNHPLLLSFILVISLVFTASPAFSASDTESPATVDVPEALSPDAISSLVAKMNNEQTDALAKLIEALDSTVGGDGTLVDDKPTPMLDALKGWGANFVDTLVAHVREIPSMIVGIFSTITTIFSERGVTGSLIFIGLLALTLGIAYAVERLVSRLFTDQIQEVKSVSNDTLLGTLKQLSKRALLQSLGIIVFWVVGVIAAGFIFSDPDDQMMVTSLISTAIVSIRFAAALLRFVLAPERADLRLVSTDGKTAKLLFRQLVFAAGILAVGFFLGSLMRLHEIEGHQTLRYWTGLLTVLWIMGVTWQARHGLTSIIIGDEENLTPGLQRMASWWPKASILIIAFVWLLVQFIMSTGASNITPGRATTILVLIVILPFLDTMVRGIAGHLVPPMEGKGPIAETAYQDTRLSYVRIGRVFLFSLLVYMVAKLLGFDLRDIASAGLGTEIAANAIGFLMILAAGYLAIEVLNLWVNRRLVKEMPTEASGGDSSDGGGAGKTRMATILPILRMTLKVTIILLTALLALSQIGVNTAPLLAGAGVLGLAIGFGAQTLVKDIVSGVFFLLDDAFRMGEYIDVGGTAGTVEKISIRSIQLRGVKGPVHIIPYGSMSSLTNLSRDWVIMKLKFVVPFDTDIDRVRRIFKKVGQQIMEIPEYKDDILAPFKSQGAADVTDVGIVIKGKFMTKPGGQWMVKREIYTRVQKMFQEYGIEFARKEIRVQMPEGKQADELNPNEKLAVAAAAGEAADTPDPATAKK